MQAHTKGGLFALDASSIQEVEYLADEHNAPVFWFHPVAFTKSVEEDEAALVLHVLRISAGDRITRNFSMRRFHLLGR